jgi:hypothetical protein
MSDKKTSKPAVDYDSLSVNEKIKHDYNNGSYSPLQLAYKHNVEVDTVLIAIEQAEMLEVTIVGDQIDDAGPGATIKPFSKAKVPYTKN